MIEKKLRKYIIPNIFAMIGMSCYILADTFFISVAGGTDGITALNLTLPLYGLIYAIGSMIGTGSATQYSLSKSLRKKGTTDFFSNSILWTLIISTIFVLFGIFAPDKVFIWMGADEVILKTGTLYVKTVLCFAPAFMLNYTFTSFTRNDNAPNIAMVATLASSIFNIIFDYIFMFPLNMGMFGAAFATGLAPIVSMLVCMIHFLSNKNTICFTKKLPSISKLLSACSLGIAGFVGEISNAVTNLVFNFILLDLAGNIAVAAYGIVANLSLVGIAIFNGISQGLQPIASEAEGTKNEEAKQKILKHSLQIGIGISIVFVITSFVFSNDIVSIFNSANSKEMSELAVKGLHLYSIGFFFAVVNIIKAGYFSAIGFAKECFIISISRGIVAIVFFAFVLSKIFGMIGVWLAFPASETFTFIISLFFGKKLENKKHNPIL